MFSAGGIVHRQVGAAYKAHYDQLMVSGLYKALTERGLLIPHEEVQPHTPIDPGSYKVLRPEQIAFVSYPYEWCFGQLKDAALATLAIQRTALAYGMSLKDCSAYNMQFRECRPLLIDTLSFEVYQEGRPWNGYRQFCQHFLAPLALMSTVDVQLGQLLRVHIDGVPLELASRMLPARTLLRPSLLFHIHLHAQAQKRLSSYTIGSSSRRMGRPALLGLIDSLRAAVERLSWTSHEGEWASYELHTNYSAEARLHKEQLVQEFLMATDARTAWDLGANGGRFSRIAAQMGVSSVAFDSDYAATESNYKVSRAAGQHRVLPLVVNLTNPSPSLGWAHEERLSWIERGPVDAILALAIVHHLAIGNNVPFLRIAELLHRVGTHLIIEFVPKTDSQVQRLLASREDVFDDYSQAGFEKAFHRYFQIRRAVQVRDSQRVIYLMRRR